MSCLTKEQIIGNGGRVIEKSDGTVNVFYNNPTLGLFPVPATLSCCTVLNPNYYFDIDSQTCRWETPKACGFSQPINLIINTKGDDGTMFYIDASKNEECTLTIDFDYLFKVKCEDLLAITNPTITTSYASVAIQNQINDTQQLIETKNAQIQATTDSITLLNTQIAATPYSMECTEYPTLITNQPVNCVTSVWSPYSDCIDGFLTRTRSIITPASNGGIGCPVLIEQVACASTINATPCYSYQHVAQRDSVVTYTDCSGVIKTVATSRFSSYNFCAVEGSITGLAGSLFNKGLCATTPVNNFNNTAFNTTTSVASTTSVVSTTPTYSYSSVNFCLTEYGLTIWAQILGATNYQRFLDGYADSYTCANVQTIATTVYPGGITVNACNVPFGTKTNLINQMNQLGILLNGYIAELNALELILIDLQDNLVVESNTISSTTALQALESLDISVCLDVVNSGNTLDRVFETKLLTAIGNGNMYTYLTENQDSGFYVCGDPTINDVGLSPCTVLSLATTETPLDNVYSCDLVMTEMIQELLVESTLTDNAAFLASLNQNAFASNWLNYTTVISDPAIISLIANKKIKLTVKVNNSSSDFCVLLDNLILNKTCTQIDTNSILIPQSPGFTLKRVIDNKKSWLDVSATTTNRNFDITNNIGTNIIRQTNYNLNDERLVLNSKEIDLDISLASAIETDIWRFIVDNPGLLSGVTYCNPCEDFTKDFQDDECFIFQDDFSYNFMDGGISDSSDSLCCGDGSVDFTKLITTDLSTINNIGDFENLMLSELIDVKNRQTISSYGTLRAIYERYLASASYTNNVSSAFDYISMDKFSHLVGNYWMDIIEQVIPSTTIWGSAKIYTNTIFDEQKFKYREYTTLICDTSFAELNKTNHIKGIFCNNQDINVITTVLSSNNTIVKPKTEYTSCDTVYLAQMNAGSEFIGSVNIIIS